MTFAKWLEKERAHKAMRDWVETHELAWAWENCTRPDWMLWLLEKAQGCESWPGLFDLARLFGDLESAGYRIDLESAVDSTSIWDISEEEKRRQYPHMCDFIRAHVKPGTLSSLAKHFEEETI